MSKTTLTEIMLKQKRSKLRGSPPTLTVQSNSGNKTITAGTECFLLGGYIQYNMSWQSLIETGENSVLKRVRSKLGALKHCCSKMSRDSKILLANGLIVSRLLYLLPVFGGTEKKYRDKLQIVLNNTARFVTGMGKRASKKALMNACGWLDINEMIVYHSLSQMWRIVHLQVPLHIHRKLNINQDFHIETTIPRIKNTESSFRWKNVAIWNQLSDEMKSMQSLPVFKK